MAYAVTARGNSSRWFSNCEALCLAALCCLLFLPGLGARDFWAPGEPIYAETLRVMYDKGDWIVPTVNGQLFPDKPVFYYWLALAVSKIAGGVSEWTVRIPGAMGALGLVLTTYLIGKSFFARNAAFISALILATCYRVFWEARFLRLDTVLGFLLLLGLYFFLKAFVEKKSSAFYLLAYACFALATLTKGPLGLVLPGLTALSLVGLTGCWRELRRMRLISGAVLVAAVIAPWLVLLHIKGEDQWVRDFLLIHNIQNYALEPIGHVRPFYYYFAMLPLDFMPWTLFVPSALLFYYPWRERLRDPATLALTCWFVCTFVFFSISKSKIAYYLLPLLPSLALLVGGYLDRWLSNDCLLGAHSKASAVMLWVLAAGFIIAGIAVPLISNKIEPGIFSWALWAGIILLCGGVAAIMLLRFRNAARAFAAITGALCGTFVLAGLGILPYMNRYKSPRAMAEAVQAHVSQNGRLFVFRSTMNDFNYYAKREVITVADSQDDLDAAVRQPGDAYLLIAEKDLNYIDAKRLGLRLAKISVGDRKWLLVKYPGPA